MIVEEQISARQQRARKAIQNILTEPAGQAYGDYVVKSASGREYRVAMRVRACLKTSARVPILR